jgi:hydrogenase maturation factor
MQEYRILLPGKVPPDVLSRIVFAHLGKKDRDLILGPGIGEDGSLIRVGESVIVAATDPITGSVEDIGRLAVHINANDVATFGVKPRWFLTSIMLPSGCKESDLERIMAQIHEAALSLDITVAGGHTEITEGIDRPIIAGFMMGIAPEGHYVTSAGARPGDCLVMSKTAAIEGTAILATEGAAFLYKRVGAEVIEEALGLRSKISVVEDGVVAFGTGHVTAMHDPTEGGLLGGIHEICDASQVGFEIDLNSIPFHDSTLAICDALSVNALELISSGCMVMTCTPEGSDDVISALQDRGIMATIIGKIVPNISERRGVAGNSSKEMPRPKSDAIWNALKQINRT